MGNQNIELQQEKSSEVKRLEESSKVNEMLKKYTMILALLVILVFFTWRTDGKILLPQNIANLIAQNAYVFVLATGMLLCILTGGNIDLSVGSVVCFVGAIGAVLMGIINLGMSIMGVDANYQKVVKGLVLLGAVIFDVCSKRQGKEK